MSKQGSCACGQYVVVSVQWSVYKYFKDFRSDCREDAHVRHNLFITGITIESSLQFDSPTNISMHGVLAKY